LVTDRFETLRIERRRLIGEDELEIATEGED